MDVDEKLLFKLRTTETGGRKNPLKTEDFVEITITPLVTNIPPYVIITPIENDVVIGQEVVIDGSASYDADGSIIKYIWKNSNNEILSSEAIFNYTFSQLGKQTLSLTVTDDKGLETTESIEVNVIDNIPPIAVINSSSIQIFAGESITFNATASTDPDGSIQSYLWTDQDGNIIGSESNLVHLFHTSGVYIIYLTVTDNYGFENTVSVEITVQANLTEIVLSSDYSSILINETLSLNALGNYDDSTSIDVTSNVQWIVSDDSIVSIDENGVLTGLSNGLITIKAQIKDIVSNEITISIDNPIVLESLSVVPNEINLRADTSKEISITGHYSDGTTQTITDGITYEIADETIASFDSVNLVSGLLVGNTTLKLTVDNISTELINVNVSEELDTSNFTFTSFGSQYVDQIPSDSTISSYDEKLLSMLTGKVVDNTGNPISNVKVSILNHSEFGTTTTKEDGTFTFAILGDANHIIRYEKTGYITSDRKVYVSKQDWTVVPEVALLVGDNKVTTIDLSTSTPQLHSSTVVSDDRGQRRTTLVFDNVTGATIVSPDGNTRVLTNLDVRATELVTPQSMPAPLPKETAFTYCSDLTVDGVKDNETVQFDKPVIMYVDNFLGFNVGSIVPVGYYDRNQGKWVASKNGVVVSLLDTDGEGKVDALDSTNDGMPNDLDGDGSFIDEVSAIKDDVTYQVGNTYWRAEITHFTPWDHNWPLGPPENAETPDEAEVEEESKVNNDITCKINSYVEPKKRVFHEDIAISGTDLTLHYSSQRTLGYKYIIDVSNISQAPVDVIKTIVEVEIAGQVLKKEFTPAEFSNSATFEWNGLDFLGNKVSGNVKAKVSVHFEYQGVYYEASEDFEQAWAQFGTQATGIRGRETVYLSNTQTININVVSNTDINDSIANGWSLSNHYKAYENFVQKGDGSIIQRAEFIENNAELVAGVYRERGYAGDGGSAKSALFSMVQDLIKDSEGNLYVIDYSDCRIRKIDENGIISTFAGNGTCTEPEENVNALSSPLYYPSRAVFDSEDNMFLISYSDKIHKIDKNGIISTFAGNGEYGVTPDGQSVKNAPLTWPAAITIDKDDNLYVSLDGRIRKIDKDGIITTVAGFGEYGYSGDGGPALEAKFEYPEGLAVDNNGILYISDTTNNRIRKIDQFGIVTTIAGTGDRDWDLPESVIALEANIDSPRDLELDNFGNLYFINGYNYQVHKLNTKGYIVLETDITKNDDYVVNGILHDKNSNLYVGTSTYATVIKFNIKELFERYPYNLLYSILKNPDNTAEVFNENGVHLKTVDLLNNNTLVEYIYDENNRLIKVVDQFSNELTITRDSTGTPTLITAPNGQQTNLTIDEKGDLLNVSYEDGTSYSFEYDDNSLLTKLTNPRNLSSFNIFDDKGRIVKEIDTSSYEWTFQKSVDTLFTEYILGKPENGTDLVFRESNLDNGYSKSETIYPNGDIASVTTSGDGRESESISNNVSVKNSYKTDIKTNQKVLETSARTLPSNLSSSTIINTSYIENENELTLSKKDEITTNSKTTIIVSDYENSVITTTSPEGRVSTSLYDPVTRLTSQTQSGNLTPTTYAYDTKGRVTNVSQGVRAVAYTYNAKGNVSTITDSRGKVTSLEYDVMDRLTKVTHPNNTVENYEYDFNGNITKRITPKSTNHSFTYNEQDQRKTYDSALNSLTSYTYNKNRRLTQVTKPSGKTIVNTYTNDRVTSTTTDEDTINYTYIFGNQLDTVTKGTEKFTYSYDGDLLKSITQTGLLNQAISYEYNNDFVATSVTYAGITTNFTYDNDNLAVLSGDYTFTRDVINAYITKVTDGSLIKDKSYDNYGELTKVSDNNFTYEITSKDNSGLILQKVETLDGVSVTYDYTYDDLGRLVNVKKDNLLIEEYSYDDNGNRASSTINGVTTSGSYTLDDQLVVFGNNTYRYDSDGFLQEKTTPDGITTYSYSTLGELKQVVTPSKTIEYKHNALNQRVTKLVNGTVVEKYLWADLTTLLAVYDGNDNLLQRFEYADSRMPISYTQGSNKYYLHYDQVGSLRAISDNSHNIVKEIVYDSFGNIVSDSNPNIKVPFAFAGGLYDEDTKLLRFGFRDYDSFTGKWTAKDPIDFDGDGYNLYGYVLNDPVNFVDTLGLFSNDMIQQAQANALAMERSIPSWRQPKYQTHNAIRNIHIQGVKGSITGATLLSDYGPAGVAAGATIGYAGRMCYGAWKESGLPSIPDEVEYLPGGKFLK